MPLRSSSTLLALLALVLAAAPAHAQERHEQRTVTGVIVDSATHLPLAAAVVGIRDRHVLTDSAGHFALPAIRNGTTVVEVRLLGYAERMVPVTIDDATAHLVIALLPDPLMLKAITVIADRFRSRREKSQYQVSTFERKELLAWSNLSMRDFLLYRGGLFTGSCPQSDGATVGGTGGFGGASTLDRGGAPPPTAFGQLGTARMLCARVRGELVEPSIWIDDHHAFADELIQYKPGELFLIEIYDRGKIIRAYTTWWVTAMARRPLGAIFY